MPHDHDHVTIGETPYAAMWADAIDEMRRQTAEELERDGWKSTTACMKLFGFTSEKTAYANLRAAVDRGEMEPCKAMRGSRNVNMWRPVQK